MYKSYLWDAQGSVLGQLLWNLFYVSVLNVRALHRTTLIGFADDAVIILKGKTVKELQLKMELEWKEPKINHEQLLVG